MSRAKDVCIASGRKYGCDDHDVLNHSTFKHHDFYKQHEALLSQPRGAGFWAWKPYLIDQMLDFAEDDTYLIYADAGIEFINNVNYIIDRMDQDIFLFGNNWEHAHWCKADIVDAIWPLRFDPAIYGEHWVWGSFGKQVQASVIFFRVSDYTRKFVKEWLDWCIFEGGRLIDDSPSRTPNHPEFQENRHDQSVLSTLAYREGIILHWWPAVYNRFNGPEFIYDKLSCYEADSYPPIFHHHRLRNHEFGDIKQ